MWFVALFGDLIVSEGGAAVSQPDPVIQQMQQKYQDLLSRAGIRWTSERSFLKQLGTGGQGSVMLAERLGAAAGVSVGRLDLLVDAPPQHREVEFRVDIFLPSEQRFRPLREVSPIVDSMARTQFDDCVKKVRLFATAELRDAIRARLSPQQTDEIVAGVAGV